MAKQSSLFRFFGSPPGTKKKKNQTEKKIEKKALIKNPNLQSPAKLSTPKKLTPSLPVASRKSSIKRKAASNTAPPTKVEITKENVVVSKDSNNDGMCNRYHYSKNIPKSYSVFRSLASVLNHKSHSQSRIAEKEAKN